MKKIKVQDLILKKKENLFIKNLFKNRSIYKNIFYIFINLK